MIGIPQRQNDTETVLENGVSPLFASPASVPPRDGGALFLTRLLHSDMAEASCITSGFGGSLISYFQVWRMPYVLLLGVAKAL